MDSSFKYSQKKHSFSEYPYSGVPSKVLPKAVLGTVTEESYFRTRYWALQKVTITSLLVVEA
jgi:hypothetical protein